MTSMGSSVSCHQRLSQSAPYKPHGVGTPKHFFGSNIKKTKRFMIFDKKRVIFSSFLTYLFHVVGRIYVMFTLLGYWAQGGGGLNRIGTQPADAVFLAYTTQISKFSKLIF